MTSYRPQRGKGRAGLNLKERIWGELHWQSQQTSVNGEEGLLSLPGSESVIHLDTNPDSKTFKDSSREETAKEE